MAVYLSEQCCNRLKVKLERKLNHSRRVQCGCNLAARGTVNRARWIAERWMIQDVEELAAEFHALRFGEGERLHDREVDLLQDIAAQDIAAGRAVAKSRRRQNKSIGSSGSGRKAVG